MMSKAGLILFVAGAGIPLMAALNSGLGARLGNPIPAAFALFLLATTVTFLLLLTNPLPTKADIISIPSHYYLGGLFVAFYVLSMTWIAPEIGLGNAILVVLFGQLVAAAAIDHYALLKRAQSTDIIHPYRRDRARTAWCFPGEENQWLAGYEPDIHNQSTFDASTWLSAGEQE